MSKMIPLITDRTSIEVDWECGMKYWWYKLEGEKGIVEVNRPAYFQEGADFHEDLAKFPEGRTLEEILLGFGFKAVEGKLMWEFAPGEVPDPVKMETIFRRAGWAIAFSKWIWPWLMEFYEVVKVEHEIILDCGDLWIACKPDLVLRNRKTGKLWYVDYKTAKYIDRKFAEHWPFALQVHLGIRAAEEELGEKVSHASILGFYKGTERDGKLRHPYLYAYTDGNTWQEGWRKDWALEGIWNYPGGLEEWIENLGEETGRGNFCWSAPIHVDDRLLDLLIARRVVRQKEIEKVKEMCRVDPEMRNIYFEMRTTHCKPVFGSPCPYIQCCFNKVIGDDPVKSGLYVPRTPHHEVELVGVEEE